VILRLILVIAVFVVLYILVRRLVVGYKQGAEPDHYLEGLEGKDHMIQDPVCHTYVPRGDAVAERMGGQTYLFCSQKCAETFQKQLSGQQSE